jgi:putative Mg2+ transporter-C (MgtC) family protein
VTVDSYFDAIVRLLLALGAGATIGIERSYHGRPAGFRTHSLVCISSSLLMLVTVYQATWFHGGADAVRVDPTRMAQGIVTGIGFLGGGVIFKEGLTVRGLTTAASIWVTSAIGILVGVGLHVPAFVATALALAVLTVFRRIELAIPTNRFAVHTVRFARGEVLAEDALRQLMREHGFHVLHVSYRLTRDGAFFEYRLAIRSTRHEDTGRLARTLTALPQVREFSISPSA